VDAITKIIAVQSAMSMGLAVFPESGNRLTMFQFSSDQSFNSKRKPPDTGRT